MGRIISDRISQDIIRHNNMLLLFLFAIPAVAWANPTPTECCSPTKFECTYTQIGGYVTPMDGLGHSIDRVGKLRYDYGRKMARYDSMVQMKDGTNQTMSTIIDYATMMEYTLFNGGCTIERANQTLYEPCIPRGAQFLSTNFIGSVTGGHIDAHTWRIRGVGFNAKMSVSADDCSPMAESVYGIQANGGITYETTFLFSDFSTTLSRLDFFDIPPQCNSAHGNLVIPFGKRSNSERPLKTFGL